MANTQKQNDSGANPMETVDLDHDEYLMLISLGLDDMLDGAEEAQLTAHLAVCSACAATWATWQKVHQHLIAPPHLAPRLDFVARHEARRTTVVMQQARRRQLWGGILFGLFAVTLWTAILGGFLLAGAYLVSSPATGLATAVFDLSYFLAALSAWTRTLWQGISVAMATSALEWVVLAYLLLAVAMVGGWIRFLQRSVRPASSVSRA